MKTKKYREPSKLFRITEYIEIKMICEKNYIILTSIPALLIYMARKWKLCVKEINCNNQGFYFFVIFIVAPLQNLIFPIWCYDHFSFKYRRWISKKQNRRRDYLFPNLNLLILRNTFVPRWMVTNISNEKRKRKNKNLICTSSISYIYSTFLQRIPMFTFPLNYLMSKY